MKNQKGFSLIELLVVVIIIGIIAAIAIPSLLASRKAANEGSAIASLRTIGTAQATYLATTGNGTGYAADLTGLGTLIDGSLASGTKSGYTFETTGGTNVFSACANQTSGIRNFGMSEDMVIHWDTAANAYDCDATTLAGGSLTNNL